MQTNREEVVSVGALRTPYPSQINHSLECVAPVDHHIDCVSIGVNGNVITLVTSPRSAD